MANYNDWFSNAEPALNSQNKLKLVIAYYSFQILLDTIYLKRNFGCMLMRDIGLFLSCSVLVSENLSYRKNWAIFPPVLFSGWICVELHNFFPKCLIEFTGKVILSGYFITVKILTTDLISLMIYRDSGYWTIGYILVVEYIFFF